MQVSLQAVASSLFNHWQRCNWWISQPVNIQLRFQSVDVVSVSASPKQSTD